VASTIQHARLEVRWINHQPDWVLLVAGDWNDTPNDRGRYSPSWVAALTGRQLAARSKSQPMAAGPSTTRSCAGSPTAPKGMTSPDHATTWWTPQRVTPMSPPIQVRGPWRANARTIFAGIVGFAALLPLSSTPPASSPRSTCGSLGSMTHHGEHPALVDTELLEERKLHVNIMVGRQRLAHRPNRGSGDHGGADDEAGLVIDHGDQLRLDTVDQPDTAHHLHLPQLHRPTARPPAVVTTFPSSTDRVDATVAHQRPIHARPPRHRHDSLPLQLIDDAGSTPAGFRSRIAHTFASTGFIWCGHACGRDA
jgi:hypothetical protein